MDLFQEFEQEIRLIVKALCNDGILPENLNTADIKAEQPRDPEHGDVTTNVAMVLAKAAGMPPKVLAGIIAEKVSGIVYVKRVEIAGPGFINFHLVQSFWYERMKDILKSGSSYGDSVFGKGAKVNVEFVSANPTGPLHVAHARGAVIGDVLANLLTKVGYSVTKEYYINDAGNQVDNLALSTHHRYLELLGEKMGEIGANLYPGKYLIGVAQALYKRDGDKWLNVEQKFWINEVRDFVINKMIQDIKKDLLYLGIEHDVFSNESSLLENHVVDKVMLKLEKDGLLYIGVLEAPKGKKIEDWEPRPQTLFRATKFGDEVDRPLKKSDGSWTYFANDVAYHYDKYERGFHLMIDVLGADHGGYVKRMKAATKAVSNGNANLEIRLCQIVHLKQGGKPIRMSKRTGTFVTLRELIDRVGKDVVRFIMLTRKNDTQMDFDLEKVLDQSKDNPVFYVQYAYARCCSVLKFASEKFSVSELGSTKLEQAPLHLLQHPLELQLVKVLAAWPRLVLNAAESCEPHRITNYLNEVATGFHALWNKGNENAHLKFIQPENRSITLARLALVKCVAVTISSALIICGVNPMEELR